MQSFLDPVILFFVFGILAGALKSNLKSCRKYRCFCPCNC